MQGSMGENGTVGDPGDDAMKGQKGEPGTVKLPMVCSIYWRYKILRFLLNKKLPH